MTWDDKFDLQFYGMICEYAICIPFIFKFINGILYKDIKWKIFWLEYVIKTACLFEMEKVFEIIPIELLFESS